MTKHNIAIIGASCRLPGGVTNLDSYWSLLVEGRDGVTEIPADRWDTDRYYHPDRKAAGRSVTFSAGVIPRNKDFDAAFFGISPKEACAMDPQQRMALELAWEAFEEAGVPPGQWRGKDVGVFVGAATPDASMSRADDPYILDGFSMLGANLSIISNRISYFFNFHGPSMTIDTACSSALVALHQACMAISHDKVPMVLAGGVNILLSPSSFIGFSKAGMLAEDGRCRSFDADGKGYVRAEGGGMFLLKPLKQAVKDGNRILAVIKATGVNTNGNNASIAMPDEEAQRELLAGLYSLPGITPTRLGYIEAHGTGTEIGDPIEARAVAGAMGEKRGKALWIGSVKANIGHLETASGAAGMLKAALVLKNKVIPPNPHFRTPNPDIDFEALRLAVPTTAVPLPSTKGPVLVGVNSFGFGGSNAHVVLEEAPALPGDSGQGPEEKNGTVFLPLSAKSEESLHLLAASYAAFLKNNPDVPVSRVAAEIVRQREAMPQRALVGGRNREALIRNLELHEKDKEAIFSWTQGEAADGDFASVFMFSGNGGVWPEMGAGLMASEPAFARTVREIDALLTPLQGWSVIKRLDEPFSADELLMVEHAQPMLFALQAGLFSALVARGVQPDFVVGHSFGEISAAWASGALSLEDAVTVTYQRSLRQARVRDRGGMASVGVGQALAESWIAEMGLDLEIAAANSPKNVTLVGEKDQLGLIKARAKNERRFFGMLSMPYPFHSRMLAGEKDAFLQSVGNLKPGKAKIPFLSTVTGEKVEGDELTSEYWWDNIAKPVRFLDAVEVALSHNARVFLEVGPNKALFPYIRETAGAHSFRPALIHTVSSGESPENAVEFAWQNAWVRGWKLDWKRMLPMDQAGGTLPALPTYAWNREFYDHPQSYECARLFLNPDRHPLLGVRQKGERWSWENQLDEQTIPWFKDHRVGARAVFPAAGFVELALAAAHAKEPARVLGVEHMLFSHALELRADQLRVVESGIASDDGLFTVSSRKLLSNDTVSRHTEGRLFFDKEWLHPQQHEKLIRDPDAYGQPVTEDELYRTALRFSLDYGPSFRVVDKIWLSSASLLARFAPGAVASWNNSGYLLPPPILDGAFQTMFALLGSSGVTGTFLPYWVGRLSLLTGRDIPSYVVARLRSVSERSACADFELLDNTEVVVCRIEECRFIKTRAFSGAKPRIYQTRFNAADSSRSHFFNPADRIKLVVDNIRQSRTGADSESDDTSERNGMLRLVMLSAIREGVEKLIPPNGASLPELAFTHRISAERLPYLGCLLDILHSANLIEWKNNRWLPGKADFELPFPVLWRTFLADYPDAVSEARLLLLAHSMLVEKNQLVSGADDAEGVALQNLYRLLYSSNGCHANDETIISALEAAAAQLPPQVKLKVLLGVPGSYGIADRLPPRLRNMQVELIITHPEEDVLDEIRARHGTSPDWRYINFSDEKLGSEQIDIAVFSHAMEWIGKPEALFERCKTMVGRDSLLILDELLPSSLLDFVFGQAGNWWRASSTQGKDVSRLRDAKDWSRIGAASGFIHNAAGIDEDDAGWGVQSSLYLFTADEKEVRREDATTLAPDTSWVLVRDGVASRAEALLCDELARLWRANGGDISVLVDSPVPNADELTSIDAMHADAWTRYFCSRTDAGGQIDILFALGFDTVADAPGLAGQQEKRVAALISLAQGWEAAGKPPTRLWLLNGGGYPGHIDGGRPVPSQGALWGCGRTLLNEAPELKVRLIDLHGEEPDHQTVQTLLSFVLSCEAGDEEREVVILRDSLLFPRIVFEDEMVADDVDYRGEITLSLGDNRKLDNLHWRRAALPALSDEDVRVQVKAVGLNFRDAMWASDMLPEHALENGFAGSTLGLEGSGVVEMVGDGVKNVKPGDRVLFFAPQCFASHVITQSHAIIPIPEEMSFVEAATIPVAFSTAWYAMHTLARLQPGESILIHGAAGGVGLAAIQIANYLGLEVYATAGSKEKRELLHTLGAAKVMSSRSLSFAEQVMDATNGRGVDAVLNSLSGEAIARGMSCLAPFGRFLELGKRDFYANSPLRLYPFRNNLSYFGIDLDQVMAANSRITEEIMMEISGLLQRRAIHPLPFTVYSAAEVVPAFKSIKQSRHIGKIVVDMENRHGVRLVRSETDAKGLEVRPNATYAVTGGTSGFGFATARSLLSQGAKHVLLLGRKDPGGAIVAAMKQEADKGNDLAFVRTDVSDYFDLEQSLDNALSDRPPLAGVIHAAVVYDDASLMKMTRDQIKRVMDAKAVGAWNLHRYTQNQNLDFFVLYSSISGDIGNRGQANYAAANAMLGTLAAWRQSIGLPATALAWGAIGDAGIMSRRPELLRGFEKLLGERPLNADEALDILPEVVASGLATASVVKATWRRTRTLPILSSPLYSRLGVTAGEAGDAVTLQELVEGKKSDKAVEAVVRFLTEKTAAIMQMPAKKVNPDAPFSSYGMDSLMAVELAMKIEDALGKEFSFSSLSGNENIRNLAERIYLDVYSSEHSGSSAREDQEFITNLAKRHGVDISF